MRSWQPVLLALALPALALKRASAEAVLLRGLPPGVTLKSPRPNATLVTDSLIVSVDFDDAVNRCAAASDGCKLCAVLDGQQPEQCVHRGQPGDHLLDLAAGIYFKLDLNFGFLPSGAHTLSLAFTGFNPTVPEMEYNLDAPFLSTRFADAKGAFPRSAPRVVVDAFAFFDEVLRIRP